MEASRGSDSSSDLVDAIAAAIKGGAQPGLYRVPGKIAADRVAIVARGADTAYFHLEGSSIPDKASFLEACAVAFKFPPHSGRNWDALEDLLRDLEWVKARDYVVLYEDPARFAKANPEDWATALEIFRETVAFWENHEKPMWVFFTGRTDGLEGVPLLHTPERLGT